MWFLFCTNGHSKKFVSILNEFHFRVPILSCLEMDLLFLPMYYFLYGSILFKIMDMPLEPPKYSFSTIGISIPQYIYCDGSIGSFPFSEFLFSILLFIYLYGCSYLQRFASSLRVRFFCSRSSLLFPNVVPAIPISYIFYKKRILS